MLGSLLKGALGPILDGVLRLIPDKGARAEAKEQFENQMLAAMTALVQGQLAINQKEAEHGSIFVAGWRPAIGWICGFGIAWNFIVQPLIMWVTFLIPEGPDLSNAPSLEVGELMTLLLGMLGLGGMRTYEKRLGVARTGVKNGKSGS
jgi:hypothetical protein